MILERCEKPSCFTSDVLKLLGCFVVLAIAATIAGAGTWFGILLAQGILQ